jgi:CRISPR-associated protein Cas2
MIEPKAGIFLGRITARLGDKLWEKAVLGSGDGACLQIWTSPGEQGFAFRSHGDTSRKMIDFEGLRLVSIPSESTRC